MPSPSARARMNAPSKATAPLITSVALSGSPSPIASEPMNGAIAPRKPVMLPAAA